MRTFDLTWFCNPNSYDIRRIKPYAAYDVTADEWAVKPPELPDWSWDKLPVPVQRILNAAITTARNTLKLREPERTLQAARLYEMWHADRSNAFGPQGAGWWDLGNLREKALDQLGLWGPLAQAHHRAENLQLADWSNTPHFGALPKTQKCKYCDQQATQRVIHSEGMAYVPACDEHLDKAKDAAARCTPDGSYDPSNVDAVRKIATMTGKDYEGTVGNRDHITRGESGALPIDAVRNMHGARGEVPGEHRNRQGQAWEDFKADIAANGIKEPIFITVDHGQEPVLSEGSHRRDAAVELGHPDIPAEVRYFGHAEQQGTVEERARHRTAGLYHWAPKDARDSIEQHGLDHRFGPARSEPQGIFFHHDLDRARDWVPGIEKTHDLYEVDGHGLPVHPDPYDTDDASYTSQPVPPERIRRLAREEGAMKESPEETLGPVREASPEEFAHHFGKALEGNPYSYHLTHHNHTSITEGNMKPLTALNGRVGVLVHDHGDGRVEATGLYNRSGVKSAGSAMLKHAMDHHGVNYVEAFGPHLPKVYEKLGFQTHEQYPFDRSLAHPNWDYHRFGEPEYHTMHLNGRKEAAMGSPNEMNWDDPEWVAAERARIEAALLAEHGPEWFEAHRATLDENWNAALAQIGAL